MSSNLNLRVGFLAFSDLKPTNNPSIRNVDLAYNLLGQVVNRPKAEEFVVPPGFTQSVFDGTRSTSIDGTSEFDVSQPYPASLNIYRFTSSGGTAPDFRTNRAIGLDNTSTVSVTASGSVSTYSFTGGTLPNLASVQVGDILRVSAGSGFNAANQGSFTIIGKTSTSLQVQNLSPAPENITILDASLVLVYSNGGSSNQVQIGDKVVISAGFSLATQGTYVVSDIAPLFFEITVGNAGGLPIETGIIPTASGMVFYNSAIRYALVAAQDRCSVQVNADTSDNNLIEPIQAGNPEQPGLYLKMGTIYALSIHNLSLEPLTVLVATAE